MGRDKMAGQLVEMWATGAKLKLSSMIEEAKAKGATQADIEVMPEFEREYNKIMEAQNVAREMTAYCLALGKVPMRWNAKPPVLSVACDVTKEEVASVLGYAEADSSMTHDVVTRMARALRILP